MTPSQWLARHRPRTKQITERAKESGWLDCTTFRHTGHQISINDPLPFPDLIDAPLPLPPGTYRLQLRIAAYGADVRCAAVRLTAVRDPRLTRRVAKTGTDSATLSFCDPAVLARAWNGTISENAFDAAEQEVAGLWGHATLARAPLFRILWVRTGWGDGTFPVYRLLRSTLTLAGYETVFIRPRTPYPWPELRRSHNEQHDSGV